LGWFLVAGINGSGDLDRDVGGLDCGEHEHSWLQTEFVGGFAAEQGDKPVRPGLDLDLAHHGVADNTAHQPLNLLRAE
jgi:hypothetical protein